jgi:hypothetical protein
MDGCETTGERRGVHGEAAPGDPLHPRFLTVGSYAPSRAERRRWLSKSVRLLSGERHSPSSVTRSGAWPSPADMPHPGHVHRRGMTSVAGTALYVPDAPASFTVGLVARVEDEES